MKQKKNHQGKKGFEILMYEHTEESFESLPTKTFLQKKIPEYIERCIECHKCMDVCPVTKKQFSIKELNRASQQGNTVPANIQDFAFHCTQCRACVPVCPKDIRRDHMMLSIKENLRNKKPWRYRRYLLIKGPKKTGAPRLIQKGFIRLKKLMNRNLACFMENTPDKKTDVLFYPGCYIYSTKTIRQTCRLLDYIGCSYVVLGGVTACCGAPHLLQGEFDQAEECQQLLYQKLKACNPERILTACAECFEALERIKKTYHLNFEVLSIAQYLLWNHEKFPTKKIRGKVLVHESCRFRKETPQGKAAIDIATRFGEPVHLSKDHLSSCCYQWNHNSDPQNAMRRMRYLEMVKKQAPTLACNCLTCYEEFIKMSTDVEIIDIIQLFDEALDAEEEQEE
jgi:heterodisulfide reductase subunit D